MKKEAAGHRQGKDCRPVRYGPPYRAGMPDGRRKPERKHMVAVVTSTGKPLMPTSAYRARKLLKKGRAVIFKYRPYFTIQLVDRADGEVQEVEYKSDTGSVHVGISVCTEKKELLSEQRDLLENEPEHHNDRKKNRRTRRNRKRYRKPRFDNRKKKPQEGHEKWLPPTLLHKMEVQVRLFREFCRVVPVTSACFEMGKFDTQALKAVSKGEPVPEGEGYQKGERYGTDTLRAAVFLRDGHTCRFCGRSVKDGAILHVHHVGYWKGDRTNRPANLASACEQCHTPANHGKNGILYGKEPEFKTLKDASYMTSVRWIMLDEIKKAAPGVQVSVTYGVTTKRKRQELHLPKSHVNDAFSMASFHPKKRSDTEYWKKIPRHDRVLQKFYDAIYLDTRDGSEKKGSELSNGRISRNHKKDSENLHQYRGHKVSKGHNSIRRGASSLKPGSIVMYKGEKMTVYGTHTRYVKGKDGKTAKKVNVQFTCPASDGKKSASLEKCTPVSRVYNTGWKRYWPDKK